MNRMHGEGTEASRDHPLYGTEGRHAAHIQDVNS